MNQYECKALAATHRSMLLERLDQRIQVAKSRGDTVLLSQLEAEADYLKPRSGFFNLRTFLSPWIE